MTLSDHDTAHAQAQARESCQACLYQNTRCDVAPLQRKECSNCVANGFRCIMQATPASRTRSKKGLTYVKHLETRIAEMEKLLSRVPSRVPRDGPSRDGQPPPQRAARSPSLDNPRPSSPDSAVSPESLDSPVERVVRWQADSTRHPPGSAPEVGGVQLRLEQFKTDPVHLRFLGESSVTGLLSTAYEHQNKPRLAPWSRSSEERSADRAGRPEFWHTPPWMMQGLNDMQATGLNKYTFPDADLLSDLVNLYFANVNSYFPLLHRPTFNEAISSGAHLRDDAFAALLLLVCSAGAQNSDDPRVFANADMAQSAGWQWFKQVNLTHSSFLAAPSLYHIQAFCVTVVFLRFSSAANAGWTLSGIALRMAQDIGAHRRETYSVKPTVQDELWRRAFWILVCCDRGMSATMGRQCAIQDEDFDIDLPTACDDEYWTNADPALAFKQPPGKPSLVSAFVQMCKLSFITSKCLRSLYAVKGSTSMVPPKPQQSERQMVADLDSALNEWIESLPAHLQWNPDGGADDRFFHQSVMLHAAYHMSRITVHRSFIPGPRARDAHANPMPSLAICTRAASAISHILQTQLRQTRVPLWMLTKQAFTSGIILMIDVWASKRSGVSVDSLRQVDDAQNCLNFLVACESRVYNAGRLADLFREITALGDLPIGTGPSTAVEVSADSCNTYLEDMVVYNGEEEGFVIRKPKSARKGSHRKGSRRSNSSPSVAGQASPPATPFQDSPATSYASPPVKQEPFWDDQPVPASRYGAPFVGSPDAYAEAQPRYPAQPYPAHPQPLHAMNMDPFDIWSTMPWVAEPEVWGPYLGTLSREAEARPPML